ncbi:MAG: hypothetical protein PF589_00800 [Gammaproteobacteria bacterium]|nr:hypothetical protein [Gammaproteobacteria bacterium]
MSQKTILLGVNIDHVATLRQARSEYYSVPAAESREGLTMEGGLESIQFNVGHAILVLQQSVKSDKQLMSEARA